MVSGGPRCVPAALEAKFRAAFSPVPVSPEAPAFFLVQTSDFQNIVHGRVIFIRAKCVLGST